MKSRRGLLLCAINAIFLASFATSPCMAADTSVVPGSQRGSTKSVLTELVGDSTRALLFFAWSRTSYCCEIHPVDDGPYYGEDSYFYGDIRNNSINTTISYKSRGIEAPTIPTWSGHPSPDDTRRCFALGPNSGGYLEIPLVLGTVDTHYVQQNVECIETTLFGGYNTNVTDFNFLEITNVGNGADPNGVNAWVTVVDLNGSILVEGQQYAIAPGTRKDIDIHSIVGPGKYGTIAITHDGAPGTLKAAVTQYRVQSWSPLDFYPVAREVFTTR